jgi:predicted aspartyl protease
MGETYATLTIHGPHGIRQIEGLADTVATFTKIPGAIAAELGIEARFETPVELGDGRTVTRKLALVDVEIGGVRRPVLVALAENGEQSLIGYTTLEVLGFKVDTVRHVLEPRIPIEY